MKQIDPTALFRLSVLGPLVSRERLERGELQRTLRELALREYATPNSRRTYLGEKTIESWLYKYRREGIDGLAPKTRIDLGRSKIVPALQEPIVAAKRDNPRRSIRQIRQLLQTSGQAAQDSLSRSAIHRLLASHGIARMSGSSSEPEEKRSFVAESAGAIWYGDVMHGPRVMAGGILRKVYLVSLFDDASRLVTHSAFCLGETALDIEGVLKQALLKRGRPIKLVVDNGAAYRAGTLQALCARLGIHVIYCRPYQPAGKGKIERWHRTVRDQFLSELDHGRIDDLADLNARLWAWLECVYHRTPHEGLAGLTPLARYQQDLPKIRPLGQFAAQLDALFHHRIKRHVRKDGTVSYLGGMFEVPYTLAGKTVQLVVDPHAGVVVGVEDEAGATLGPATRLDKHANLQRDRRRPDPAPEVARAQRPQPGGDGARPVPRQEGGLSMYLQHFGLRHAPLGKDGKDLWDDGALAQLAERFSWLLQAPGVGLITGEPGGGKTAALRSLSDALNPHRYQVIYQPETDFGRLDLYRSLATALGVEPSYRRAQLWRDIKQRILEMVDGKQLLPVWIIDEAQNLPVEFFRDLPAFLNFAFDSRELISVWLVGHPGLAQTLERAPYAALHGRIATRVQLRPVVERERFALMIGHALKTAGCQHTLLADSGMEVLRQASKGLPRMAGRILRTAMRLAVPKGLNHLPDELLQQAIEELR